MKKLIALLALLSLKAIAFAQNDQNVIAEFIKADPEKSAIFMVHNGKILADINADRKSPLASTVKIIVAIEYATQVAAGTISPATLVDTFELNKYYIPNTDGGAQPGWLSLMQNTGKITDGKVPLEEVAKGMINFSSNANTEYLLDLLGLDNVNAQLAKLGLVQHDSLYYFIAALGVIDNKKPEDFTSMSMREYRKKCDSIHQILKTVDTFRNTIQHLGLDVQKVWSDRLPGSTPKDYVSIMQKINQRNFFTGAVQENIDIVMEGILQNPANRQWLEHCGMKGGSTVWVLTKALYATTKDGNRIEMAYFFNNLTFAEAMQLQKNMNSFELAVLANKDGKRDKIVAILNSK